MDNDINAEREKTQTAQKDMKAVLARPQRLRPQNNGLIGFLPSSWIVISTVTEAQKSAPSRHALAGAADDI
jgi:hypothetical protein